MYFDMEGYNPSGSCSSAVVNFLGGWTGRCMPQATSRGYRRQRSLDKNLVTM